MKILLYMASLCSLSVYTTTPTTWFIGPHHMNPDPAYPPLPWIKLGNIVAPAEGESSELYEMGERVCVEHTEQSVKDFEKCMHEGILGDLFRLGLKRNELENEILCLKNNIVEEVENMDHTDPMRIRMEGYALGARRIIEIYEANINAIEEEMEQKKRDHSEEINKIMAEKIYPLLNRNTRSFSNDNSKKWIINGEIVDADEVPDAMRDFQNFNLNDFEFGINSKRYEIKPKLEECVEEKINNEFDSTHNADNPIHVSIDCLAEIGVPDDILNEIYKGINHDDHGAADASRILQLLNSKDYRGTEYLMNSDDNCIIPYSVLKQFQSYDVNCAILKEKIEDRSQRKGSVTVIDVPIGGNIGWGYGLFDLFKDTPVSYGSYGAYRAAANKK
ncbi:hypothetical protein [Candidatus Cytomitobacter primus]|uniref:Uncharacterized protein n=1 Tax=Candidatus Cytomitobacter primus TaxID=2066024 RepID=A0A5C0UFW7_9PROT|nr:hypothetical protein [Candidatus Cytomitobacter primus]QEK38689.1 hypothetical protein FZC34_02090 [Candidatus Cytomitobacter primus]